MVAQVNTHQCMACGAVIEDATGQVLPQVNKPPVVSNAGYVVREISTSTAGDVGPGEDRRNRPVGDPVVATPAGTAVAVDVIEPDVIPDQDVHDEIPDVMGPGDIAEGEDNVIDLSQLTPEQAEAIERIVGGGA